MNVEIFKSIGICALLSTTYLGSLHIWNSPYDRNHPSTVKKRFISVFVMLFIAPLFLYMGLSNKVLQKTTFLDVLGIRLEGLFQAITIPLFLTFTLFLGPISIDIYSALTVPERCQEMVKFKSLLWIRNMIAAPFSEEFTYRCCMLPLLLQSFSPTSSVFLNPLFFGFAHLHHLYEKLKFGMEIDVAIKSSVFQFAFTTVFGIYSSFLFLRTRHFASIFVVHSFCNLMGFPDLLAFTTFERKYQCIFLTTLIFGFICWILLLVPVTNPSWYSNDKEWWNYENK